MEREYRKYIKVEEITKSCRRENGYYLVPEEMLFLKIGKYDWKEVTDLKEFEEISKLHKVKPKVVGGKLYYAIIDDAE